MQTKIIVILIAMLISLAFLSFKNASEESSSKIATVMIFPHKGDNEGLTIVYGDGTTEKKHFETGGVPNLIPVQVQLTQTISQLSEKGFHLVGTNDLLLGHSIFIFEIK